MVKPILRLLAATSPDFDRSPIPLNELKPAAAGPAIGMPASFGLTASSLSRQQSGRAQAPVEEKSSRRKAASARMPGSAALSDQNTITQGNLRGRSEAPIHQAEMRALNPSFFPLFMLHIVAKDRVDASLVSA